MIKKICQNYEPFYNMVLSTTILSNTLTKEYCYDAEKIVRFVGEAYGADNEFICACADYILNTLSRLGRNYRPTSAIRRALY